MNQIMDNQQIKKIIEGILFLSLKPLNLDDLEKFFKIDKEKIRLIMEEIKSDFSQKGINLIEQNDKFELVTSPEINSFLEEFFKMEMSKDLTQASIETLALIAYLGPITRSQIEALRGVNSSYILRELLIRGLIEREEKERTYYYKVSLEFLKFFGLKQTNELPRYQEINQKLQEVLNKFFVK